MATINVRAKDMTVAKLKHIAEKQGLSQGETIEKAIYTLSDLLLAKETMEKQDDETLLVFAKMILNRI